MERDNHGKQIMDPPEELFTKFLVLDGSLPDCAKGCPIQLCSTYYTSLSRTVSDCMIISDDYTSLLLVGLDTKEAQLEALQVVREGGGGLLFNTRSLLWKMNVLIKVEDDD